MAFELRNETPLSLAAAARMLPPFRRGRPVSASCIFRWIVDGVKVGGKPVRLDAVRIGGRWITSVEALERFAAAQTPDFNAKPEPPTSASARRRQSEHAAKALEAAGA